MKKSRYTGIALGAFIAAAYAVLTYSSAFFGLAYGGVQFRVSEALTILSIFTPYAIPGLAVGCILGNLTSPYGIIDIICGTSATFFAAVAAYLLRKIKIKNLPLLSISMPIFANGVIVGAEIAFF
ncbi:MAG: QueT transporter family protein, partial [Clostridia bacterium]